jgi:hypothetical protein
LDHSAGPVSAWYNPNKIGPHGPTVRILGLNNNNFASDILDQTYYTIFGKASPNLIASIRMNTR